MNYIVYDVEFNNPGGFGGIIVKKREDCPYEILEIGAVKLNENLKIIDTFRLFVKPTISRTIHPRIIRKIKITQDDLKYGFNFPTAYKHFEEWCGDDVVICSWGKSDVVEMIRNCQYHEIDFDISSRYLDIQLLYQDYEKSNTVRALAKAVKALGLSGDYVFHNALDDSKAASSVLVDIYDKDKVGSLLVHPDEVQFPSARYITDKTEIESKNITIPVTCPTCNKTLEPSTHWRKGNEGVNLWALGTCNDCQNFISYNTYVVEHLPSKELEITSVSDKIDRNRYRMFERAFTNPSYKKNISARNRRSM